MREKEGHSGASPFALFYFLFPVFLLQTPRENVAARDSTQSIFQLSHSRSFASVAVSQFVLCRIIRAMQLSCLKIYLPRENWITYEEDLEYRYLDPYVREINAEWDEMNEFDGFNYWDRDWPEHEAK